MSTRTVQAALLLPWLTLLPLRLAQAQVQVLVGATPIINGNAHSPGDITVVNEHLAFAIAVNSPMPYGVPRGAIIDVAPVVNGLVGRDRVVFADFIPNHWSAWPNTYQHIDIVEQTALRAVIRSTRDWGKVTIATQYTLRAGSDAVEIQTTMTNNGPAALPGLLSGLTLWPSAGYFFSVPGTAGIEDGKADGALSDRASAYDEDWAITLHAPYVSHVGAASKDLALLHTLAPGESRTFDGWLQVGSSGDLAPALRAEIEHKHLPAGTLQGQVRTIDGKPVSLPILVIEKQGKPFGWAIGANGRYELQLPAGEFEAYATAKNYSQSARAHVTVSEGATTTLNIGALQGPGRIEFAVADAATGKPLDARIVIDEGQKPLVEFLGKKIFFTEIDRKGTTSVSIAPGKYRFTVSSGGGFTSQSQNTGITVLSGKTVNASVSLTRMFDPAQRGWYGADLHHHSDQAEAVTPPSDLARSQFAAGLDLLFVGDHDSTANHLELQRIADRRGVPFIPGIELSASWGHFNAFPLMLGQKLAIDTSIASAADILREARRQGAIAVQVNHPFIAYGYLTSVAGGVATGGFVPGFDLLEINASTTDDDKVLRQLWAFWNAGHRYYLTAGTDTHDVWNDESGRVRAFAHVDGALSAAAFAQALKDGHAYVSYGPLMFPAVMFGSTLKVAPEQSIDLSFDFTSVSGMKSVTLIGDGAVAQVRQFDDAPQQAHLDFNLKPAMARWYALIAEDARGHKAYSDPIWIDTVRYPLESAPH